MHHQARNILRSEQVLWVALLIFLLTITYLVSSKLSLKAQLVQASLGMWVTSGKLCPAVPICCWQSLCKVRTTMEH